MAYILELCLLTSANILQNHFRIIVQPCLPFSSTTSSSVTGASGPEKLLSGSGWGYALSDFLLIKKFLPHWELLAEVNNVTTVRLWLAVEINRELSCCSPWREHGMLASPFHLLHGIPCGLAVYSSSSIFCKVVLRYNVSYCRPNYNSS